MTSFRVFPQFNQGEHAKLARVRARLSEHAAFFFPGERHQDRLAREIVSSRTTSIKEILESFELFHRVRRRLRAPVVADLCCGHGLLGILFGVFERRVERVILVDHKTPASAGRLLEAAATVAPWVRDKVERLPMKLASAARSIEPGTPLVAVHACGFRTDRCIDLAVELGSPLGAMPCCYKGTAKMAPPALRKALGAILATDVQRTYRLEGAGFEVTWKAIPEAITPMNRVIIAMPRSSA